MVFPVITYSCKSWTVKKAEHQRTDAFELVVLEKNPESPLDSKEVKPVNLKWDQPWTFTGRTNAEGETPVFWSCDVNRRLMGKVPEAEKDQGQNRASEDEMAGRNDWHNEHELGQAPGDGEGQGGLAHCGPWGRKESNTTGRLNNNNDKVGKQLYCCCCFLFNQ